MLQNIPPATFAQTYVPQLVHDFPHEIVRKEDISNVTEGSIPSSVYLYREEDITKAYAYLIESNGYTYCCFLAVLPNYRRQGIGTKFLSELMPHLTGSKAVIAEVEDPSGAKNADEKIIREKRIRFYEHLGFSILPDIEFLSSGIPYLLAVLPLREKQIVSTNAAEAVRRIYQIAWDPISDIPAAYRVLPEQANPQH